MAIRAALDCHVAALLAVTPLDGALLSTLSSRHAHEFCDQRRVLHRFRRGLAGDRAFLDDQDAIGEDRDEIELLFD